MSTPASEFNPTLEVQQTVNALTLQVQTMVEQSGDPRGFDAGRWLETWLETPLPALGGDAPEILLDTVEGRARLGQLLDCMQSSTFA